MEPEDTFHEGWGCDSTPCLGIGKPGSRAGKAPHLRTWIKQICTPPSSLGQSVPLTWSADEQNCLLGLLLGTVGINSVCQDPGAGCCKFLSHSPTSQIPSVWELQIPLQSPWCKIRVGVPRNQPTVLREAGCTPPGFSFSSGGTGGSEETSLHGAMLALGWCNVVNV